MTRQLKSSAKAQKTTWRVTVDVTGPGFTYNVTPTHAPTCDPTYSAPQPNTGDLHVCAGDKIEWEPNKTDHDIFVIDKDGILDHDGKRPHGFHGSHGKPGGGTVDPNGSGRHEYSIVDFDSKTKRVRVKDPVIIIGGGN